MELAKEREERLLLRTMTEEERQQYLAAKGLSGMAFGLQCNIVCFIGWKSNNDQAVYEAVRFCSKCSMPDGCVVRLSVLTANATPSPPLTYLIHLNRVA
jgi:hypothetical protein